MNPVREYDAAYNPNYKGPSTNEQSLYRGAYNGKIQLVKEMLVAGVPVDSTGILGDTPLMGACTGGHKRIVELLLSNGASVFNTNQWGNTALHECTDVDCLEMLVREGGEIDKRNEKGYTPLCVASQDTGVQCVNKLISLGAEIDARRFDGCTPLIVAIVKKKVENVRVLVAAGADVNIFGVDGCSPLRAAAQVDSVEITELLIRCGANPNYYKYLSPLHVAVYCSSYSVICVLVHNGADIGAIGQTGHSPITFAIIQRNEDAIFGMVKPYIDFMGVDNIEKAVNQTNDNIHVLDMSIGEMLPRATNALLRAGSVARKSVVYATFAKLTRGVRDGTKIEEAEIHITRLLVTSRAIRDTIWRWPRMVIAKTNPAKRTGVVARVYRDERHFRIFYAFDR